MRIFTHATGWSFGGVLALEVARGLITTGIKVKGLILIDSPAPQTKSAIPDPLIDEVATKAMARNGTSPRTVTLVQEQMRYATHALVNYEPTQSAPTLKRELRAVYLRSLKGNAIPQNAGDVLVDPRVRAFFTKTGDEWTIPMWEEVLGGKMLTFDIPGDHFGVFDIDNVIYRNAFSTAPWTDQCFAGHRGVTPPTGGRAIPTSLMGRNRVVCVDVLRLGNGLSDGPFPSHYANSAECRSPCTRCCEGSCTI